MYHSSHRVDFYRCFLSQLQCTYKLNAGLKREGKEDPAISGDSLDSLYTYIEAAD